MPDSKSRRLSACVLYTDRNNRFWRQMADEYDQLAAIRRIDVDHIWPEPDSGPESQLILMRRALRRRYRIMIVHAIDKHTLVQGVLEAALNDIHIIDVGARISQASIDLIRPFYTAVKTIDYQHQGELGGAFLAERIPPGGKVVIVEGPADETQSVGRSLGAADTMMKAGLSIVAGHSANNNRSLTRSVMRELLRRHPDTKGVFCATDEMALGVVDAVEGLGMAGQVTIVGVDLVEEALDAILDGRLTASVAFSPQDVAAAAMDAVDRKLKGEAAVDDYTVPSRVFT